MNELEQAELIKYEAKNNSGRDTNFIVRIIFMVLILLGIKDNLAIWNADTVHKPNTDRTILTSRHPIRNNGSLTSIIIDVLDGSPNRDVYARILLEDEDKNIMAELGKGYLEDVSGPHGAGAIPIMAGYKIRLDTWSSMSTAPTLRLRGSINRGWPRVGGWTGTDEGCGDGPGKIRLITGTDPAQNNNISETIATNSKCRLLTIMFSLTTDSTVGTRQIYLCLTDGSTVFIRMAGSTDQSASSTKAYSFQTGVGYEPVDAGGNIYSILPSPQELKSGFLIYTETSGFESTDNYGAPVYVIEEWLDI